VSESATTFESFHELIDNAHGVLKNPAFQEWRRVMEEQMDERRKTSSNCMKNLEEALERNYMNGEAAGIQMALQMWQFLIEGWETEKRRILDEKDADKQSPQ
jgi:16S rRNA A1518/A1519 N6-dimethyltransferase RsmA/KsgA/DIM1 with predicted DNA glycosylase/AP lyase activity